MARWLSSGPECRGNNVTPAQLRAFMVHIFTASGAGLALAALWAAAGGDWALMFGLLGVALFVDGIDGTMARGLKVAERLPRWSGDVLDLVVDFGTYVLVPAYAIATSALLPPPFGLPAGIVIVVTSAIYFADREMKTTDNYFRGFPALWNGAAFYLFLLKLPPWLNLAIVIALAVLTFAPFKFLHPFRVVRLRALNIAAIVAWAVLAFVAIWRDLDPGVWITGGLVAIGLYIVGVGLTDRWIASRAGA
jgi:phosphatidylcholine synthase